MELPPTENTVAHWGWVAKSYHWIIALLILAQIPLGFYGHITIEHIQETGDMTRLQAARDALTWHKSLGLVLGLAMVARLYWRSTNSIPPLSRELPDLMRKAAATAHWLLYALVFVLVISGFVHTEHSPSLINFFFLFEIPQLFDPGEAAAEAMEIVHKVAGYGITGVAIIHIAAALFHHFAMKDDTLVRMLPGFLGGRHSRS